MIGTEAGDGLDLAPLRALLAPYGALVGARRIQAGDEAQCADAPPGARIEVRRASGAARIAARILLADLKSDPSAPLTRAPSGAPTWPEGIVGSLAHDKHFAVAAAARRGRVIGLGIDVEPAEPLPGDVAELVLSDGEQLETGSDGVAQRLVFACKEAVYKATHPLDGAWLDFPDIEVRLAERTAILRDGRRIALFPFSGRRLVAVALLEA